MKQFERASDAKTLILTKAVRLHAENPGPEKRSFKLPAQELTERNL